MHPVVLTSFRGLIEPWEGCIPYMYLDQHNPPLVTVGVGCNINDPRELERVLSAGVLFTFKHRPDISTPGVAATNDQVTSEWRRVKTKTEWRGQWYRFESFTQLELQDPFINRLIQVKLGWIEEDIRRTFPALDSWPADAQLGLMTMLWSLGTSRFRSQFHNFIPACRHSPPRWRRAAAESRFQTIGARQRAIRQLFENAHAVAELGLAPEVLYYPEDLSLRLPQTR